MQVHFNVFFYGIFIAVVPEKWYLGLQISDLYI